MKALLQTIESGDIPEFIRLTLEIEDSGNEISKVLRSLKSSTKLEGWALNKSDRKAKILAILKSGDIDYLKAKLATATELDLPESCLTDEQACLLAEALETNDTITQLDLGWLKTGEKGVKAIWGALGINSTLREVTLSGNKMGRAEPKDIEETFKANTSITNFNLYHNPLGDEGAKAIGKGLKANDTLKILNLRDTNIGEIGIQFIAEGLEANSTLVDICVMDNLLGIEGARTLKGALQNNLAITKLSGISSQDAEAKPIRELLARNEKLAQYNGKFDVLQKAALGAIKEGIDIKEILKLLCQRQCLISKNPMPDLFPTKNSDIDLDYIVPNYFYLIGVCKPINNESINKDNPLSFLAANVDCMEHILSYLAPTSLYPKLFPCAEELPVEETQLKIELLGEEHLLLDN